LSWSAAVLCAAAIAAVTLALHLDRTVRRFLLLRQEAKGLLILHWQARVGTPPSAAINHYRQVGGELFAFNQSQWLTAFLMRWLGYRPRDAGTALIAIASAWAQASAGSPDDEYGMIERTLYPQRGRFRRWHSFREGIDVAL
jgi:hypothetical protein